MTTSHPQTPRRGALVAAAILVGGLFAGLAAPAQAAPPGPAPIVGAEAGITPVQYGWGPHHHHHRHGWRRRHHWDHHHHHGGWGRHRGWGPRHHFGHHPGHHGGWGGHHGHWH